MRKLLSHLGINSKSDLLALLKQFVKFGIVGVSNTLISLGVYYLLIYCEINYILSNTVGFVSGVCNAYFWNSRFVFKGASKGSAKPFIKSFLSYGSTFLLSTALLFLQVDILHISAWLAPLINLCVTVPINFLLNKYWAFK